MAADTLPAQHTGPATAGAVREVLADDDGRWHLRQIEAMSAAVSALMPSAERLRQLAGRAQILDGLTPIQDSARELMQWQPLDYDLWELAVAAHRASVLIEGIAVHVSEIANAEDGRRGHTSMPRDAERVHHGE